MYLARSVYSGLLRAGRSGDRIPMVARYSATVHTCRGAHPTCTMGTGSLSPGVIGHGVTLTNHPPSSTEVKEYTFDISSENDVRYHRNFRGCVEISEKFIDIRYDENPSVYSQIRSMRTQSQDPKLRMYVLNLSHTTVIFINLFTATCFGCSCETCSRERN